MSQTNTNTVGSNYNRNQHSGRGGRGQGGSGGRGRGGRGDRGNNTIAKSSFDRKMKDGCLNKLIITECSHRATQFKKIHNVLPVLCAYKGFNFIDNVIRKNKELEKVDHLPVYPDETRWSTILNVEINTVYPTAAADASGACPNSKVVAKKTHVFDANLQKKLLSQYDLNSKINSQEWAKHIADKKAFMTIISGECEDATLTKLALGTTYAVDRDEGNLIKFLDRLKLICYKSDDGGLSYKTYKVVVAVKSLHNFTNPKPDDPHGFKE